VKETPVEAELGKMRAQLKLWSLEIDKLAATTQAPGARTGFEDLM